LPEFAKSFSDASKLIIPDIYFSRDKKEDVEWMTVEKLVEEIEKVEKVEDEEKMVSCPPDKGPFSEGVLRRMKGRGVCLVKNGNGLENTAKLIREYDEQNPGSSVILLLGAGDVDSLRSKLKITN
jgi:UDP-N-acetylmuramate-alanine ligase